MDENLIFRLAKLESGTLRSVETFETWNAYLFTFRLEKHRCCQELKA